MTHVILHEDGMGYSIMCVERNAQICLVLCDGADRLGQLTSIAASMNIPRMFLIVRTEEDKQLAMKMGWHKSSWELMVRELP